MAVKRDKMKTVTHEEGPYSPASHEACGHSRESRTEEREKATLLCPSIERDVPRVGQDNHRFRFKPLVRS